MASKKDITVGSIWKNGNDNRHITVTDVDDELVEYGYPNVDQIFYLTIPSFLSTFRLITNAEGLDKEQLLGDLRTVLLEIKALGQGDRVYALLDSMGI